MHKTVLIEGITIENVTEKINEKVIMDSPVHRYDGFEFRIFVEKKNQKYF